MTRAMIKRERKNRVYHDLEWQRLVPLKSNLYKKAKKSTADYADEHGFLNRQTRRGGFNIYFNIFRDDLSGFGSDG